MKGKLLLALFLSCMSLILWAQRPSSSKESTRSKQTIVSKPAKVVTAGLKQKVATISGIGGNTPCTKRDFYMDFDGDGYGDISTLQQECVQPAGTVTNGDDCNDFNENTNPGAPEICDNEDNDCDGEVDEGFTKFVYFEDSDGDGFGTDSYIYYECKEDPKGVTNADDCDDDDATVYPGAPELCDGKDNDCDYEIDEGIAAPVFYSDKDGDGFGDPQASIVICEQPEGTVTNGADCDDANPNIYPGAPEVCNEVDDNCDGEVDEGFNKITYYRDQDGDGFGSSTGDGYSNEELIRKLCEPEYGWVTNDLDCDDVYSIIYPGAPEVCDGLDNDCDGQIDEGCILFGSLTVIESKTDKDLYNLFRSVSDEYQDIDLSTISGKAINIRANIAAGPIGSTVWELFERYTGKLIRRHTENTAPLALFSNKQGDYFDWIPKLGEYDLFVYPYSGKNGTGKQGTKFFAIISIVDNSQNVLPVANAGTDRTLILPETQAQLRGTGNDADGAIYAYKWQQESGPNMATFSSTTIARPMVTNLVQGTYVFSLMVEDNRGEWSAKDLVRIEVQAETPVLAGFTLVNSTTNQDIALLQDGVIIDLSLLPNINVRVNPGGGRIRSVRFGLNSNENYRLQNRAPFALANDNKGDYLKWNVQPGSYTIKATGYTGYRGSGLKGATTAITIHFVRSGSNRSQIDGSITKEKIGLLAADQATAALKAFPNPTTGDATIVFSVPKTTRVQAMLIDLSGRQVQHIYSGVADGGILHRHTVYTSKLASGIYLCRIATQDGRVMVQKIVRQ